MPFLCLFGEFWKILGVIVACTELAGFNLVSSGLEALKQWYVIRVTQEFFKAAAYPEVSNPTSSPQWLEFYMQISVGRKNKAFLPNGC